MGSVTFGIGIYNFLCYVNLHSFITTCFISLFQMFGAIKNLCNNILALDENEVVMSAIRKPEIIKHIIYLNAFDQLFLGGLNTDGDIVGEYRKTSELFAEGEAFTFNGLTKRKIAGDAYFFYDSGGFLKSFSVSIKKDGFTIKANDEIDDPNFNTLTEKFGQLVGLTNESKTELGKKILPDVRRLALEKMLKKISR